MAKTTWEEIRKKHGEKEKEIDEAIISICRWIERSAEEGENMPCELPEMIRALADLIEAQGHANIANGSPI